MKKLSGVNKICRYLLLKKRRTHHRQFLERNLCFIIKKRMLNYKMEL
jgi:hypothetical protein